MTIAKCRECSKEVSDEASTCPHCGIKKPVKKTSRATWLILGLIIFGVVMTIAIPKNPNAQAEATVSKVPAAPKKLTQNEELQQLALKCVETTKSQLHDQDGAQLPNAYNNFPAEFATKVKDSVYAVQFEFHAKNGLNALRSFTGECKWKRQKNGDFDPVSMKNWPN